MRKTTLQEFIDRSNDVHGQLYDYSSVSYINTSTKVDIICKIHGAFNQSPRNHLRGQGCPKCGNTKKVQTNLKKFGVEYPAQSPTILQKMRATLLSNHDVEHALQSDQIRNRFTNTMINKYGVEHALQYSPFKNKSKQTTLNRFKAQSWSQQHLINVLDMLDDEYWLSSQYELLSDAAIASLLGCDKSLIWRRRKEFNIKSKHFKYSVIAIHWLNHIASEQNIYIQHALNEGEYQISGTKYKADGYCASTNTIYEFHGDCFHGNPNIFEPTDKCHPKDPDITAGELYEKTLLKEQTIRNLGYNVISIWETDYRNLISVQGIATRLTLID